MTTQCPDPRMNELLGSYLLGACPDDEADAMREHLATCAACAREAAELVVARDALLSVPPTPTATASPELKERVMAQVRADAELFAAARERGADGPAVTGRPAARPRRGWRRSPLALGAAAACALVLVAGGALLGSSLGGDDSGQGGTQTELGAVNTTRAPGATAKLVIGESGAGRLVVSGMPDPGKGRVYQVWLQRGAGAPIPTRSLFSVMADGSGETTVPGDLTTVDQVMVTSEPSGGSATPTPPVMVTIDV